MSQYTYTFDDLIRMIGRHVPRNVVDDQAADICNLAYNQIWHKYDWRESLKTLPPFYLIPGEQEVGAPFYSVPSDFAGLRKADFVFVAADPPARRTLKVIKDLNITNVQYFPHAIDYNMDTQAFRVFPRCSQNMGAPQYQIEGTYKTVPTKITPATLTTSIPTKDDLIQMWMEGMLWAAYKFTGDQKAGQIQMQNGNKVFTGQLAIFHATMDQMAANEGLELGDVNISPCEPLFTTYNNSGTTVYGGFGGY